MILWLNLLLHTVLVPSSPFRTKSGWFKTTFLSFVCKIPMCRIPVFKALKWLILSFVLIKSLIAATEMLHAWEELPYIKARYMHVSANQWKCPSLWQSSWSWCPSLDWPRLRLATIPPSPTSSRTSMASETSKGSSTSFLTLPASLHRLGCWRNCQRQEFPFTAMTSGHSAKDSSNTLSQSRVRSWVEPTHRNRSGIDCLMTRSAIFSNCHYFALIHWF